MSTTAYQDIRFHLTVTYPGFSLVWKEQSRLMRVIAFCLMILTLGRSRDFMSKYTTVIGNTVYIPSGWTEMSEIQRAIILRHEGVHMKQRKHFGLLLFSILYLFVPLPGLFSWWRMRFEMEAYTETLRAMVELYPDGVSRVLSPTFRQKIIDVFVGPMYFWMWPFRSKIELWYDTTVYRLTHDKGTSV